MELSFETDYSTILKKLDFIDPVGYCNTRNYIDGAVTYLSPYISRGVISTKQVYQHVLNKGYSIKEIEHFIKELCWRDYFQRLAQVVDVNKDIKHEQPGVGNKEMPNAIFNATSGIEGIDVGIQQLYKYGYMHNHNRMYTAALVCNIAKSHWYHPAQWMYYHLLDGDWTSNACSWQWVAGANSNKKYYANQENINKFTYTNQRNTFLDNSYEKLPETNIPEILKETISINFKLEFPNSDSLVIDHNKPTYLYNYYNLDPNFGRDIESNRILLIEPNFFKQYPVSKKCMDFMIDLSKNIENIQIYVGSFESFKKDYKLNNIVYKEHPFNNHYSGIMIERDWIVEEVKGYFPSFFAYWKKIEKLINL